MTEQPERDQSADGAGSSGRTWIWRLGGLVVSVVALLIVVSTVDLAAAWEVLKRADPAYIAVAWMVMAVQLVVRGWRWRILLPPRPDGHQVSVARTISPMLVGYLGNAILPARLGEPIRAFLIARRERLDTLTSFVATVLERLVDVVTLALLGLFAALALGAEWWVVVVGAVAGLGGLVVLGLLVAVGLTRMTAIGVTVLSRIGLQERTRRLQQWALSFAGGIDRGRDIPTLLKAMALSFVAWVLDALVFWLVALSLGIDLGYAGAIVIGAVAVLSTAIPAAPGYVGTFELAATAAAVALGIPEAEALAMAVLVHVITLLPLALAGAIAVISTGTGLGRLAEEAEEAEHESA